MCTKNGILDDWFGIQSNTPAPTQAPKPQVYTPPPPPEPPAAPATAPTLELKSADDLKKDANDEAKRKARMGRAVLRIDRTVPVAGSGSGLQAPG